jgi:hypothetical protein
MSFTLTNRYHLTDLPEPLQGRTDARTPPEVGAYLWSATMPPPPIGARVTVKMNGLGPGIVRSYFVEHGWLGVYVKLDAPPAWHTRQTAGHKYAGHTLVFGAELEK